jgi:perosamine synthetase
MARLAEKGIETRPFFIPLHRLPPVREESARRGENLPVTDRLSATGLNLPTFVGITDDQIGRVVEGLRSR